jgi:urease accessory protein UreF
MQDPPKVATAQWCLKARAKAAWLQQHKMRKADKMEELLQHLEDEISWVESLIERKNKYL